MIGRPYPRSTATAWAFIATSSPPLAAPSRTSASTRRSRLGASPGVRSETASASAANPDDAPAPEPGDQRADYRHGDERADRGPEQGDAEQSLAQAEPLLYGRYPYDPGAYHHAVREEHGKHRKPRRRAARDGPLP